MRLFALMIILSLTACGGGEATDQEKLEADIAVAKANGTPMMTTEPVSQSTCGSACE